MSETPAPEAATDPSAPAAAAATPEAPVEGGLESELSKALKEQEVSIKTLIEAGVHYGHQPGRWNPLMRSFIFGERNGTHIVDLDQTLPMLKEGLDFLRETTAEGGKVLFVGTKRQAEGSIRLEAMRAGQYYVNNRWLGGMLTNWKTVKKSIDRYNQYLDTLASPDKREELSKKEQSSMIRAVEKYAKSLEGIKKMDRQPDAIF
ncbi:MAG: 30S ribosomal protein S2, partial [bacterium]